MLYIVYYFTSTYYELFLNYGRLSDLLILEENSIYFIKNEKLVLFIYKNIYLKTMRVKLKDMAKYMGEVEAEKDLIFKNNTDWLSSIE
jgi:hypothetical protein